MNFSRVLVTGGAGFIGSHLATRLLKEGFAVVVLDNLSTGCLENLGLCLDTDFLVALLMGVPEAVRKAEELDSIEAEISTASMNACQLPLPKRTLMGLSPE